MEELEPREKKPVPEKIVIEISDPILLGFRLACGPFFLILAAGFILFLAFLFLDMAPPSF